MADAPNAPEQIVQIPAGEVTLQGRLALPDQACGIVVFAHGSGSSRFSPRNRFVADELQQAGLATLLFDLLSADEEAVDVRTRHLRFDISLLARRVCQAKAWLDGQDTIRSLSVGYFGASTGAAAALVAAAREPGRVSAIVSRGGRPDLAGNSLPEVRAATLLIVGERDTEVLELNRRARALMKAETELTIVPGASHLFEEAGALEKVSAHATDWFTRHLQ
ncbi:MAG: dienelactone hydrolase family protein [Planctomycetota bacterium]